VPDEEEQFEIYKKIIAASPHNAITIRTLDIGGDKTVAYLGQDHNEANPFMGWRSIRLSFEHPEFFNTQIRAIIRAANEFPAEAVRIMFPMVTTVEELRKLREMPFGMMVEVPAAAMTIDIMLDLVDFVSIGSNDLVQYLMGPRQPQGQPFMPATCSGRIDYPQKRDRRLQPARRPHHGLRRNGGQAQGVCFAVGIKQLAKMLSVEEAEQILASVMKFKTTAQVNKYMTRQIERIAPKLSILDSD